MAKELHEISPLDTSHQMLVRGMVLGDLVFDTLEIFVKLTSIRLPAGS